MATNPPVPPDTTTPTVPAGGTGSFTAALADNEAPVAGFAGPWTWGTNDPSATVTVDPADPTGATVTVALPPNDQSQSFVLSATTQAPDGSGSAVGSLTIQVVNPVDQFTVVIEQKGGQPQSASAKSAGAKEADKGKPADKEKEADKEKAGQVNPKSHHS